MERAKTLQTTLTALQKPSDVDSECVLRKKIKNHSCELRIGHRLTFKGLDARDTSREM